MDVELSEVTTDDTGFTVWFESGGVDPCWVVDSAEVDESEDDVTVTVRGGNDPAEPDAICIEISEFLGVRLPVALDGRTVVDGSTGSGVAITG